jgi:hypothetical protein
MISAMRGHRVLAVVSILVLAVTFLGGCSTVPVLSDPASPSPGTLQKTITELRTQTVDLLNDAITATGAPTGWLWTTVPPVPWDSDINKTRLRTCSTVGTKESFQMTVVVHHHPVAEPHATAKVLADHWKSQGFTIETVIDWTKGDYIVVQLAASRADGVSYSVIVNTETIAIHAYSECSTDPSFQAWIDGWIDRQHAPKATPTP